MEKTKDFSQSIKFGGGGGGSTSPSQRKDTHYPQKSFLARTKNYNGGSHE